MTSIKISNLPPAPAGTGTGTSQGTDLFPATDTTDTTSSSSGTTKKYTLSEIYNWMLQAQGLTVYDAVLVATTGALTASYDNGTDGVGATLTNATTQIALSIDGVTLSVASRVLVWQQTDSIENGIYVVTNVGSSSTNWIMTRATDYDEPDEIIQYGVVLVNQGDTYASKLFQEIGEGPFTIGSTAITFALYTVGTLQVPVLLSQGGTSASLTASNGGIFYSTSSAGAILAGTATANQILQSGAGAAPSWSTTTYPATNAINTIMYASSANVLGVITPVNSSTMVSNGSGVPSWQAMSAGEVLIGTTSGAPVASVINSGTGIVVDSSSGSITISATGGGLATVSISGTSQVAAVSTKYIALNAGQTTLTLPSTYAVGDIIVLIGASTNTGGWIVQASSGDTIRVNNATTSSGGSVTCTATAGQCITLVCDIANTSWIMMSTSSVLLTTA